MKTYRVSVSKNIKGHCYVNADSPEKAVRTLVDQDVKGIDIYIFPDETRFNIDNNNIVEEIS
jgi:hypothetical protein